MYNLLVAGGDTAWETGHSDFYRSRFLEYTNEEIADAFRLLTPAHIEKIKSYPCLFAYESESLPVRVGRLTHIEVDGKMLRFDFKFDDAIPPIPYHLIASLSDDLDIRRWEMNRTHWAIKDKELFDILVNNDIIKQEAPVAITSSDLPPAPFPTESADSVFEFIGKVLAESQKEGVEVFYRGHSDRKRYKLEPSLFRKDSKGNYLHLYDEHLLYRELLVSNSADFVGDVYTLDRLVRMQHHSLPTRLLDITSNPLIALYFACKSGADIEGEVIILSVKRDNIKYFDSDTASCIANLARLPQSEKDLIDFDHEDFNHQNSITRLIHLIREEKSFFVPKIIPNDLRSILCVKGKKTNDRISSQAGAFLLFGVDAILDESGNENITVRRLAITNKNKILKQLDQLDINESTVFPYLESSARYLANKYKNTRSHTTEFGNNSLPTF